jgi:hypothetical protein
MPILQNTPKIPKILDSLDLQNFKQYRLNSLLESPEFFELTYEEAIICDDNWWQSFLSDKTMFAYLDYNKIVATAKLHLPKTKKGCTLPKSVMYMYCQNIEVKSQLKNF